MCSSDLVQFTTNADGRTMSATLASGGRMRIYPNIPAFKKVKKFGSIVSDKVKFVKIISSGSIERAVVLKGIKATKGAKIAIEAAGGRIEV